MKKLDLKKLKYDTDHVIAYFGIKKDQRCVSLDEWLQVVIDKNYALPPPLEKQRQKLAWEGDTWNEEELKMHFLSFVFFFADFEIPDKAKLFFERPLSGTVQDIPLSVICDAMLATPLGINTPKVPYFFLQEFKKGKKAQDDAEGQMLVAMLLAQEQNNNQQAIYGCYLQGRYWNFAILLDRRYCISRSYDATQTKDLIQIIYILRHLTQIVTTSDN